MKKIFLPVLFVAVCTLLGAQNDTTFITTSAEEGVFEKQTFDERYDDAFGADQPTRVMLKAANFFAPSLNEFFPIGLEVKLSPGLSIHTALDNYINIVSENGGDVRVFPSINVPRVEPRYYYAMPRRVRAGKSANNLSGNYIGLEAAMAFNNEWNSAAGNSLSLRFGIQRRLFRIFYFDAGIGAGVTDNRKGKAYNGAGDYLFFLSPRIQGGIGLTWPRPRPVSREAVCDVSRCFREEGRLFKIDLANVLRMANFNRLSSTMQFAAEQKIGQSPFSLEGNTGFSLECAHTNSEFGADYDRQTLRGGLEGRWYYTLKKRIASGKSDNNLQGAYLALSANLELAFWQIDNLWAGGGTTDYRVRSREIQIQPKISFQQRLFKHGYVDFSLGPAVFFERQKDLKTNAILDRDPRFDWIVSRFGVGVAF